MALDRWMQIMRNALLIGFLILTCREAGEPLSNGSTGKEDAETSSSGQGEETEYTHFLCVSPDAPTNPVLYWLGNFDAVNTRFLLESATGPHRLDLGDTLYAPNLLEDHQVSCPCWDMNLFSRADSCYPGCVTGTGTCHIEAAGWKK